MYSKEQITFLMNNGFSLDEIMQMNQPDPAPAPQPDPEPVQAPQPDPEPAQAPQTQDNSAAILQAIASLTQAVQMQNIRQVGFGVPPEQRDVNQVLGEIINPPRANK